MVRARSVVFTMVLVGGGPLASIGAGVPASAAPETSDQSDFNGDGFADLAVGVPYEDEGGGVAVLYGSSEGLSSAGNQLWTQDSPGVLDQSESDDLLGYSAALATGDFNGDGFSDLAAGAYGEELDGAEAAGGVNVLYGSSDGLTAIGNQFWHQDSPGILDRVESVDWFGWAVATADFNRDGFTDLAVGAANEGVGSAGEAGAVHVLYGSRRGLSSAGNQLWTQDTDGMLDQAETPDEFGRALAGGDFNGDGNGDLAVGVPNERVGGLGQAGAVNVLYGSTDGLSSAGNQFWTQDSPGVIGRAEGIDVFGFRLATGDFNGSGFDALVVGVLHESLGEASGAGAVNVLYGSPSGLSSAGNQFWSQNSPGVLDRAETDDWFGWALAVGDFSGDNRADLAVGANQETIGGAYSAGAVNVLYGSAQGLTAIGNQLWTQDSPGVIGIAEYVDSFGGALAAGDFGDGIEDDLAAGASGESIGEDYAGAVNVLYGSRTGLSSADNQFWSQDALGVVDEAEFFDLFGIALA